uniref:Uncharacterized protein n=1 Tax=Setaria digitata TaxID=48799 RepID=A0A915Q0F3_9BILA
MSSAVKIYQILFLNVFVFAIGAISPSGSQSSGFVDDYLISEPKDLEKQEWNMEYSYGRNYKHSEGQEWGTGYRSENENVNSDENQVGGMRTQKPEILEAETSPAKWSSFDTDESLMYARPDISDAQQLYKLRVGELEKNFQEKRDNDVKNWQNWPKKNLAWSNWDLLKSNHYDKQPVPWWSADSQQPEKARKVTSLNNQDERFMLHRSNLERKQPFWLRSVGWKGDLGSYGEIPPPPWLSKISLVANDTAN